MKQLGQLQDQFEEMDKRNTAVIAISNEEKSIEDHAKVLRRFNQQPKFSIGGDINREKTTRLARTGMYFVDMQGVVRQVFASEIYRRPPWWAVFNEMDRILAGSAQADGLTGH